ncbi:MAG: n-acetylglutamate synthase [Cryomorphaceae bacterium]|nr:n-acetylglutamate synthase [Cryomorphaceae bacterium]
MDYNGKTFVPIQNTPNGETSGETVFKYTQIGNIVTSEYAGGKIKQGHLIGIVDEAGTIDMRYHQVNSEGKLMTGKCLSVPEILENGKIRLHETWEWTSGDLSSGQSIIEER